MNEKMKVLIAYDGSECAGAALEDLKHAGLPRTTEARVLSLADVFLPPPGQESGNTFPMSMPAGLKLAHEHAERKLREATAMAQIASDKLRKDFPEWKVSHEALADSPAWAIIRIADHWHADLIVVGAHGHSVFGGRLILGSVSQRVLYEARCSVRIGRSYQKDGSAPLLVIGVDNSRYSAAAIEAVCNRDWPSKTRVKLLAVVDTVMEITPDPSQPEEDMKWIEVSDESHWQRVEEVFQPSVDRLRAAGLEASLTIRRGNAAHQIVEEAETWGANCIFLGPKGTRGIDRLLLGSVTSAVSARAHCSVEVVRVGDRSD